MNFGGYEVRVTPKSGEPTVIACDGRNADATAARESKRRAVVHAEIHYAGVWLSTWINGRRAFGASDN
jgi:hypothetical protein